MKKVVRLGSAIILSLSLLSISLPAAFATSPVINQYSLPSGAGPERLAIDRKGDIWFSQRPSLVHAEDVDAGRFVDGREPRRQDAQTRERSRTERGCERERRRQCHRESTPELP